MVFDEKSYILGIWVAEDKNYNSLVMFVKKGQELNSWEAQYVFRYKEDDKVFDSKDRKSGYEIKIKNTPENEVTSKMHIAFDMIAINYDMKDYLNVQGDIHKMFELGKGKPWFHFKEMTEIQCN